MTETLLGNLVDKLTPLVFPLAKEEARSLKTGLTSPRFDATGFTHTTVSAAPIVQPVLSAVPWDWPRVVAGETSSGQWRFCDAMPQSAKPGATYLATADSFTNNYTGFLQVIDGTAFQPANILADALKAVSPPTGSPVNDSSPPGWTKVPNEATYLQWRLIWSVSSQPDDWTATAPVAGVSYDVAGPRNSAVKDALTLGDTALKVQTADGTEIPVGGQALKRFSLDFESSGMVTIRPGEWYNSFIVGQVKKAKGPFIQGYSSDTIFGTSGLLSRRAGGFLIGSNPTMEWQAPGPVDSRLAEATSVSAAGVTLEGVQNDPIVTTALQGGGVNYAVKPKYTSLYILGVVVERV